MIDRAEGVAETAAPAAAARPASLPGLETVRSVSGYAWSILGATALGFALRVFLLGTPPLWRDEAFTAVAVRRGWLDILNVVRHDSAPPLGYILVKLANTISPSAGSLRMVSALAGTAAMPLAATLGRRIGGNRAGMVAAATMAVLPSAVMASRDLRMYALASTLVLATALALWRAIERPSRGRLLVYFLCVVLAVHTQYFAVLGVAGQLLAAFVVLRPGRVVLLKVGGVAVAAFACLVPWLLAAIPQFQHTGSPFWVQPFHLDQLQGLSVQFLASTRTSPFSHAGSLDWLELPIRVVGAGLFLAPLYLLLRRPTQRRPMAYVALAALVPVGLLLLVGVFRPLFDARYASVMWGPLIPAMGAGLAAVRRPAMAPVVAVVLLPLGIAAAMIAPSPPNDDVPAAMAPLAGHVGPDDFVAVNGAHHYYTVAYYEDAAAIPRTHVIANGVAWFEGTAGYGPDTWMTRIPDSVTGRIYVVGEAGRDPLPVPSAFSLMETRCVDHVCVETWARR